MSSWSCEAHVMCSLQVLTHFLLYCNSGGGKCSSCGFACAVWFYMILFMLLAIGTSLMPWCQRRAMCGLLSVVFPRMSSLMGGVPYAAGTTTSVAWRVGACAIIHRGLSASGMDLSPIRFNGAVRILMMICVECSIADECAMVAGIYVAARAIYILVEARLSVHANDAMLVSPICGFVSRCSGMGWAFHQMMLKTLVMREPLSL